MKTENGNMILLTNKHLPIVGELKKRLSGTGADIIYLKINFFILMFRSIPSV